MRRISTVLLGIYGALLVGLPAMAQVGGQGTGLVPTGVVCRNLTTGQQVLTTTGEFTWDCGVLGLAFSTGDRVETGMRGEVPLAAGDGRLDPRASLLPEDFSAQLVSAGGSSGVLPGDLDGDGDVDIVTENRFRWYENVGGTSPSFVEHSLEHLIPGGNFHSINDAEILDVDGDGRLDVVAAHNLGAGFDQMSWFRNDGGSPLDFSRFTVFAEQAWDVRSPKAADVDGDGDMDFFFSRSKLFDCPCFQGVVWAEDTGGVYVLHEISQSPGDLLAVDIDLDGDPDVVFANLLDNQLSWFENDASTFSQEQVLATDISLLEIRAADIDGDGDPDIVAVDHDPLNDARLNWFENLGNATFAEHLIVANVPGLQSLTVADFSSDGLPDVLIGEDEVSWFENQGGSPPSFLEHTLPGPNPSLEIGAEAADIDQDGRLDLVARTSTEIQWHKNQIGRRLSVTGVAVRGFFCRNRSTGQTVRVPTTEAAIDCENEGLTVGPGDEIEVFARGQAE